MPRVERVEAAKVATGKQDIDPFRGAAREPVSIHSQIIHIVLDQAVTALSDGIRYLRGGSAERAWKCFETAARTAADPAVRSEALRRQADLKRRQAEWAEALDLVLAAVQIATDHALPGEIAAARNVEGTIHLQRGELDRAIEVFRGALGGTPDDRQRGLILQNLGTAHVLKGERAEAATFYARSAAAFGAAGSSREQLLALVNQGNVRLDEGDAAVARSLFESALTGVGQLPGGDTELQALIELNLAESLVKEGRDLDRAFELLVSATGYFTVSENRPHRLACHRVFAMVTEAQGLPDLAVGALDKGLRLAREIESALDIDHFEREIARLRGAPAVQPQEPPSVS